jgi:hypothetical protein
VKLFGSDDEEDLYDDNKYAKAARVLESLSKRQCELIDKTHQDISRFNRDLFRSRHGLLKNTRAENEEKELFLKGEQGKIITHDVDMEADEESA